jgi:hypothetical protein
MSTTSDELIDQFVRNGACQNILAENGDLLLSFPLLNIFSLVLDSMNSFVGTLQTLVTKTMEDTLMTIKAYEKSRSFSFLFLQYD